MTTIGARFVLAGLEAWMVGPRCMVMFDLEHQTGADASTLLDSVSSGPLALGHNVII